MNTPQTWSAIGFEVEFTGDGSPSLRMRQEPAESMHHSGGAAEETELIYGAVIRRCFVQTPAPHFLSVGLGLGYVELTVAREALLRNNFNFTLESFELVPELRQFFILWLKGENMAPEIQEVYDLALDHVLKGHSLPAEEVKSLLVQKWTHQEWRLQGPLLAESLFMSPAQCLLFDAFSAKTSPDLWDEEFLVAFFQKAMAEDAMVSTYACRSALKKALKRTDFAVKVREGFKGKRNSTLGLRGTFAPKSEPVGTSSHIQ